MLKGATNMGRVRNAIINGMTNAGNKIGTFWENNGKQILTGAILGLATIGASELTWTAIGGRKLEHEISKAVGYSKGFEDGQKNATNVIAASRGADPINKV